jgi:DNA (cytosine-5)-methyltransferase 1
MMRFEVSPDNTRAASGAGPALSTTGEVPRVSCIERSPDHDGDPSQVGSADALAETFWRGDTEIVRRIALPGVEHLDSVVATDSDGPDGAIGTDLAEAHFLRARRRPHATPVGRTLRALDLFAGCGGLSLGFSEACRALHGELKATGVDTDAVAAHVFSANIPHSDFHIADVVGLFDGAIGSRRTRREKSARMRFGSIEILLGGPPCQGHSAFNNRTRHSDTRNDLYLRMVRAAEVLEPEHVVIENVPGATRDRKGVVQRAVATLESLGYSVARSVFDAAEVGVPQRRRRLLVVASQRQVELEAVKARHRTRPRSVRWAIGDLETVTGGGLLDEAAASAPATRRRIDYLFDHDLFDLPNEQRPACHANGGHSYRSIYGRLSWDEPAQTLTTGFYCMCMGRYVHPSKRRTLTAREAARIQFFPDWFDFTVAKKRSDLARLIGNAVPSKLGYVIGVELLR